MIDINKVRSDFPILSTSVYEHPLVYLDNAATTQKPQSVIDMLLSYYSEMNSNIHRGIHYLSEKAGNAYENARESVRAFINAKSSHEIIFTHGATSSINLIAQSFGSIYVKAGDEIIITEMEHHSNLIPWQLLCKQIGATLKVIPFDNNGELQTDILKGMLTEKTKLITMTYVSNVLGTVNPVKEIISFAHSCGVPVLIDGAQAIQHIRIDVQYLDCDFFVFSGHKMYAETGIGILYGKEHWLELMPPYQTGGGIVTSVDFTETSFMDLPFKFEAGTPHISGALSLKTAIDYINSIGISSINSHEDALMTYAREQLSLIKGVMIYGNPTIKCGVISFNLDSISPYDASMILDKLGIAVRSGTHCAQLVMKHYGINGTIRISFALYNTREEINTLVKGIQKVQALLC